MKDDSARVAFFPPRQGEDVVFYGNRLRYKTSSLEPFPKDNNQLAANKRFHRRPPLLSLFSHRLIDTSRNQRRFQLAFPLGVRPWGQRAFDSFYATRHSAWVMPSG